MKLAPERRRETQQGVDTRRPPSTLEPGDGRLRGVAEPGELRLGETELVAPLGDLRGDGGKEPAFLGMRESTTKALHRSRRGLSRSHTCYIAILRYRVKPAGGSGKQPGKPLDDRSPGRVLRIDHVEVITRKLDQLDPSPASDAAAAYARLCDGGTIVVVEAVHEELRHAERQQRCGRGHGIAVRHVVR